MSLPPSATRVPRRHRPRDARATRARLVRAAMDLFTGQGYRGTTTPEIAERAGVAEATIYRHFTGKEALLNAACLDAFAWGRELVLAECRAPGSEARGALERLGRLLVERAAHEPALVRMLLRPAERGLHEERTRAAHREFLATLHQVVAGGKQQGRIRAGSAELWASLWLALTEHVVERVASSEWPVEHPNIGLALAGAWDAIAYRMPEGPAAVVPAPAL